MDDAIDGTVYNTFLLFLVILSIPRVGGGGVRSSAAFNVLIEDWIMTTRTSARRRLLSIYLARGVLTCSTMDRGSARTDHLSGVVLVVVRTNMLWVYHFNLYRRGAAATNRMHWGTNVV